MKILNLVYPHLTGPTMVESKRIDFPDGQIDVVITGNAYPEDTVLICSRFNSFNDLGVIAAATASLREIGVKTIHLYIPYLLGARSDRKFVKGGNRYLTDVVAKTINSLEFESVTVIDPHSDVAENVINNLVKDDNSVLVSFAFKDISLRSSNITIVAPDAGAQKKIYTAAKAANVNNIITASKHRDVVTGNILSTQVPGLGEDPGKKDYVIIDDICDGGRTFTEIAKVILNVRPKALYNTDIYLIVTHGIFSAKDRDGKPDPFTDLSRYFTRVYCTNSVQDLVTQAGTEPFVKQLNVF